MHKLEIKPWRKKGDHIVIAHQPNLNFNWESRYPYYDNCIRTCLETGRRVLLCLSPVASGRKIIPEYLDKWKSWGCEVAVGIEGNLDGAYCMVAAGGTTVTKSILKGIPAYCIERNVTDPLGIEKNLVKFLGNPSMPCRTKWLNWAAYQQWTLEEMRRGEPFEYLMKIKDRVGR